MLAITVLTNSQTSACSVYPNRPHPHGECAGLLASLIGQVAPIALSTYKSRLLRRHEISFLWNLNIILHKLSLCGGSLEAETYKDNTILLLLVKSRPTPG
jgi:hypothetical protein